MTSLQLLDFRKLRIIFSHFDSVFRCFYEQVAVIRCLFSLAFSHFRHENGALAFLRWTQRMKNSTPLSRRIFTFSAATFLLIFLIASCDPVFRPPNNPGNCPYELTTEYHTYDFGSSDSKYVYVLIDQSYEYKFRPKDFELISSAIIPNMFPGDRLVITWINLERGTQAIIFDERIHRERIPQFPPTLNPPPVTPTLTPSNITTIQGQQIQTNEAIERDNQVINEKYYCKIGEWNATSDDIFQKWKDKQKEEIDSFSSKANTVLTSSTAKAPSGGKLLYESLSTASQMLQSAMDKRQHQRYILIVFSDMHDWRSSKPDDMQIELNGVDTLIVSQNCKYEIDCQVKVEWEAQLKSFGAANPLFLVQEDNIERSLYDYLSIIP